MSSSSWVVDHLLHILRAEQAYRESDIKKRVASPRLVENLSRVIGNRRSEITLTTENR